MKDIKDIPDDFVVNERRGPYTNHNGPFLYKKGMVKTGFMELLS